MSEQFTESVSQDSKNLALIGYVLTLFFSFIPALVLYFIKADDRFVHAHAKELLNFSINFFVYYLIASILTVVLIGLLMMPVLFVLSLIALIKGALAANKGEQLALPFVLIRLLK